MMTINKRILRTITIIFTYAGLIGHTSATPSPGPGTGVRNDTTKTSNDDTAGPGTGVRDDTTKTSNDDTAKVHVNDTGSKAESTSSKFE